MILYTTSEGSHKHRPKLRTMGWRILLTPDHPTPQEGVRFALDNGAWTAYQQKQAFDGEGFKALIERYGGAADFVIAPDIVAGGMQSLEFSRSWLPYLRSIRNVLLPVQDGMEIAAVWSLLSAWPGLGIFLGGTTEYKLRTMYGWGMVAHSHGRYYHVGRVNSVRRIRLAHEAGAHSTDGSSAAKWGNMGPRLSPAALQSSLLTPALLGAPA